MARDRRRLVKAEPPEHLLRFSEGDWSGMEENELTPGRFYPVRKTSQWYAARLKWIKGNVTTREEFDRLYFGDDVRHPPDKDAQAD